MARPKRKTKTPTPTLGGSGRSGDSPKDPEAPTIRANETKPRPAAESTEAPAGETLDQLRSEASSGDTPGAPKRRKPGRPKGSGRKKQEPVYEPPDSKALGAFLSLPFSAMAERRGEHWKLTTPERDAMAESLHVVLMKYGTTVGPEIGLTVVLLLVVGNRVWIDIERARAERDKRKLERQSFASTEPVDLPS